MADYFAEETVVIQDGAVIEPYCVLKGKSFIGKDCTIGSFSYIENSTIQQGTVVRSSRITDSTVGKNCTVGPNAHLRQGAKVGDDCRVGNYVEIKNSVVYQGVKASHLAYIGDAEVGENTNIGCGVIFVNFDGKDKHKTTVGKNCFIGCNSNLVAPLSVGDDCFVACGTTVDKDLPDGAFCIGRSYLTVKEGKAYKYIHKPL